MDEIHLSPNALSLFIECVRLNPRIASSDPLWRVVLQAYQDNIGSEAVSVS